MRRAPTIRLEPLMGAVAAATSDDGGPDDITDAILDATLTVFATGGLRRCTMDDIAEQAGLGRTTIYRRFDGRDDLIHAVLAREARRTFADISAAVAHLDRPEDRIVDGIIAGLRAAERSPLMPLVRTEPELLRLVTADSGVLIEMAVAFLVDEGSRLYGHEPTDQHRHLAELLVRFATSLMITPQSGLPLADDDATRSALHALLDPLLQVAPVALAR
jgi:AcrR family transcriptional regulator